MICLLDTVLMRVAELLALWAVAFGAAGFLHQSGEGTQNEALASLLSWTGAVAADFLRRQIRLKLDSKKGERQ